MPACFYWEVGCCTTVDISCRGQFITGYAGRAINIIEISGFSSLIIVNCKFINLNIKKSSPNEPSFQIDGLIYFKSTVFSQIKIASNIFENINFKSFLFGSNDLEGSLGTSNMNWINNSIFSLNNLRLIMNSTFRIFSFSTLWFENSKFDRVQNLFTIENTAKLSMIKCQIYGWSSFNFNTDFMSINVIKFEMNDTNFMNGFYSRGILYINALDQQIMKNVCLFNQTFLWDNPFSFNSQRIYMENVTIYFNSLNKSSTNVLVFNSCEKMVLKNIVFINTNSKTQHMNIRLNNVKLSFIHDLLLRGIPLSNSRMNMIFYFCNFSYFSNFVFMSGSIVLKNPNNLMIKNGLFVCLSDETYNFFSAYSSNNLIMINCLFEDFVSRIEGSVFNLGKGNTLIVIQTVFNNLTSLESASLLYASSQNSLKFTDVVCFDLKSFDTAGGISMVSGNILIIISSFIRKYETVSMGGFILATQTKNIIKIMRSYFRDGFSAEGALMYLNYDSSLYFESSLILNNTANFEGGALKLNIRTRVFIANLLVKDCFSYDISGTISAIQENLIKIQDSFFNNSVAISAGFFSLNIQNNVILSNCSIWNAVAREQASLFKINSNNVVILKNSFISSIYLEKIGGLILIEMGNLFYSINSFFFDCYSSQDFYSIGNENTITLLNNSFVESSLTAIDTYINLIGNNYFCFYNLTNLFTKTNAIVRSAESNKIFLKKISLNNILLMKTGLEIKSQPM